MVFTYATVCSGVEGCSLALDGMGWQPVFFSEIEPFPCAVLKAHYPNVPDLGDMSKISYDATKGVITNGKRSIQFHGRLDLLAGGTPCQDFSVAGLRKGGAEGSGTRSSLMWEWLRLASELRPRVIFWENVVGCLSTNNGRDFSRFVSAVGELGYCVAWRVLDCQYTRVDKWPMAIPQRRRRVWLVGCLGADVSSVAKILFEPKSVVGDNAPRRCTGQAIATAPQGRNRVHGGMVEESSRSFRSGGFGAFIEDEVTGTLDTSHAAHVSNITPSLIVDKARKRKWYDGSDTAATLTTGGANQFMPDKGRFDALVECYENHDERDGECNKAVAGVALDAKTGFPCLDNVSQTVVSGTAPGHHFGVVQTMLQNLSQMRYIVRRLTPTECERLMGYPDNYTIPTGLRITDALVEEFQDIFADFAAIMEPNKPVKRKSGKQIRAWLEKVANPGTCPDAPRYKCCGNGWAINSARWVLQGVDRYLRSLDND